MNGKEVHETETAKLMGSRIQAMRQSQGMSIGEFSRLSGFARSSLQNYEAGNRQPSLDVIKRLAGALGCSPAWLSTLSETDAQNERYSYHLINQPYPNASNLETDSVMFSTEHIRAAGANSYGVKLLKVCDNNLTPDIYEGDEVLIDTNKTSVTGTADLFCVADRSQQMIIRWARRDFGKDGFTLYSNNDSHFPPVFVPDDSKTISVIGRVISIVRWR